MSNRVIKFRAWNKKIKRFAPDNCNIQIQGAEPHVYFDIFDGNFDTVVWSIEDCELMQFTGLHDKNGVEIYEGDICKITDTDEDSCSGREFEHIGYVAWGAGKWRFKDKVIRSLGAHDWTRYSNLGDWDAVFEVIGNIYETPTLLEDNK